MSRAHFLIVVVTYCSWTGSLAGQPDLELVDKAADAGATAQAHDTRAPEDRLYTFRLADATYREILEAFARQSGLELIGDPPEGRVSFDCGHEQMSFKLALNRLTPLLFNGMNPHGLRRMDNRLEVVHIHCGHHLLPQNWWYSTVEKFREANVPDTDLVFVVFRATHGLSPEMRTMAEYTPNWVRVTAMEGRGAITLLGTAKDVRRYVALTEMLDEDGDFVVRRFRFDDEHWVAALRRLKEALPNATQYPPDRLDRPSPEQGDAEVNEQHPHIDKAALWLDEPRGEVIVKCPQECSDMIDRMMSDLASPHP